MRVIKSIFVGALIFGVLFACYVNLPRQYRHMIADWYSGLLAPGYIDSPDLLSARDQADLIREYKNRNYDLKCFSNLQHEEKISRSDDYLCYAYISTAFDKIPAKLITFFFSKNKLSHVRIEFPEKSFAKLQDYLSRKLANYPRLDKLPIFNFGTDNFGRPLMVWGVKEGLISTSASSTPGQTQIILWSAMEPNRWQATNN